MEPLDKVRINVGGVSFVTSRETTLRYPGTRLAELDNCADKIDNGEGDEYFFDRDPAVFACILNFYRTKELHVTQALCGNAVRNELAFWKISETVISPCCWRTLHQVDQDKEIMQSLDDGSDITGVTASNPCCFNIRRRIWTIMDKPNSSLAAKIWNMTLTAMVLLASITYCLDTLPELRTFPQNGTTYYMYYVYFLSSTKSNREPIFLFGRDNPNLEIIDQVCLVFFTLELLIHLLVCPQLRKFLFSFYNVIDILAVLIGWTVLVIGYRFNDWLGKDILTVLLVLKSIYVIRLFRVFRFMQSNPDLRIITLALNECKKELVLLMLAVSIIAVICGSFVYFCEDANENFNSIPISVWWAVVTMTTVGYGDMYPTTPCGYAVGSICGFIGVLALSLPVAVIATHFSEYYCINLWWREYKRKMLTVKKL